MNRLDPFPDFSAHGGRERGATRKGAGPQGVRVALEKGPVDVFGEHVSGGALASHLVQGELLAAQLLLDPKLRDREVPHF